MPDTPLPFLNPTARLSTENLLLLEGKYRTDSIVLAFEHALQEKQNPTEAERVILAIEAVEREVNNGGFSQFFFNSSRAYAYFAPVAFRLIGAPWTADLCSQALAIVTQGRQLNGLELQDFVANLDEDLEEQLGQLDSLYYKSEEEPLADRLLEYIKLNREHITASAP